MKFKSILVATDLSTQESLAIRRASQLAELHGSTIKLMYLPQRAQPAAVNAAARLTRAAHLLESSLGGLRVKTVPARPATLDDLAQHADGADLVVVPYRRERSAATLLKGQPAMRIVRDSRCPVLVTRPTGGPSYHRILVAVDFSQKSQALVKFASSIDPRAELEIFHALSTRNEARLRSAEAPEHAIHAYREHCLSVARSRMVSLTDSFDARRNRVQGAVGRGDPGREIVIQQEKSRCDLVVVGRGRASAWEDFLSASIVQRVLAWNSSDVLVIPQPPASATSAASAAAAARHAQPQPGLGAIARRSP